MTAACCLLHSLLKFSSSLLVLLFYHFSDQLVEYMTGFFKPDAAFARI
jgi:hypothetical protein